MVRDLFVAVSRWDRSTAERSHGLGKKIFDYLQRGYGAQASLENVWASFTSFARTQSIRDIPSGLTPAQKRLVLEHVHSRFMLDDYVRDKYEMSADTLAKRQKELRARIHTVGFCGQVDFAYQSSAATTGHIDAQAWLKDAGISGDPLRGSATFNGKALSPEERRYVILMMPFQVFDGLGGRPEAFARRLEEFSGVSGISARAMDAETQYNNRFGGERAPRTRMDTSGRVIGFPVSSQVKSDGTPGDVRGIAPMMGAIEVRTTGGDPDRDFMVVQDAAITQSLVAHLPREVFQSILAAFQGSGVSGYSTAQDIERLMARGGDGLITFDTVFFTWGTCGNAAWGIRDIALHIPGRTLGIHMTASSISVINEQGNAFVGATLLYAVELNKPKTETSQPSKPQKKPADDKPKDQDNPPPENTPPESTNTQGGGTGPGTIQRPASGGSAPASRPAGTRH